MIWSPLLIVFAAICNSSMDIVKNDWSQSIFSRIPYGAFWYYWFAEDSWLNKFNHRVVSMGRNKVPIIFTDNWHFAKFCMVVSMCFAAILYKPVFDCQFMKLGEYNLNWVFDIILLGLCWNVPFDLFYNKVWRLSGFRV